MRNIGFIPLPKAKIEKQIKRMEATIRGDTPDKFPTSLPIMQHSAVVVGFPPGYAYINGKLFVDFQLSACAMYGAAPNSMHYTFGNFPASVFGGKLELKENAPPTVKEYGLKTVEDIEKLEIPDAKTLLKRGMFPKKIEALDHAQKRWPGINRALWRYGIGGGPFTLAGNIVDPEKLFYWMRKEPRIVHLLLKKMVEFVATFGEAFVERYGNEQLGGTSAVLDNSETLTREQFKEFSMPALIEMGKTFQKLGLPGCSVHMCGDHTQDWNLHGKIPGLMYYHVGDAVDIEDVAKKYGKDMIIQGNIPTDLILNGSAKEVYEEAKRQVLIGKEYCKRGFVTCSACEIPPYSPPANVYAMAQATEDFGTIS